MGIVQSIASTPWMLFVIACFTLGLAPFSPPHIVEKLGMLFEGKLVKPIDWFDLFLHGTPWIALMVKGAVSFAKVA